MRDPYPGNVITDPLNSSALAIQNKYDSRTCGSL